MPGHCLPFALIEKVTSKQRSGTDTTSTQILKKNHVMKLINRLEYIDRLDKADRLDRPKLVYNKNAENTSD